MNRIDLVMGCRWIFLGIQLWLFTVSRLVSRERERRKKTRLSLHGFFFQTSLLYSYEHMSETTRACEKAHRSDLLFTLKVIKSSRSRVKIGGLEIPRT